MTEWLMTASKGASRFCALSEEGRTDGLAGRMLGRCHLVRDGRQHSRAELCVEWDREVVLWGPRMGEANMTAILTTFS